MNGTVIRAVFRRNFTSYFSNPTGYVFICVYVVLCALAAFWSVEFFNNNLANLDQLNRYYPLILLVFIPAITMSIWAEEKRQGTDELLLTIPATDFDVVLGKYLAAAAIFSVTLLYSMFVNVTVLSWLGQPDLGLMFATHFGYWLMGLAMLAVGMSASFLTSNLTVSFILGALLNAPLVALMWVDSWIPNADIASAMKQWSISERFRDFARGVVSLPSVMYFVLLAVVMLFAAMVLIGRRHWFGGKDNQSMAGHYFVRFLALLSAAVGAVMLLDNFNLFRYDATQEKLSTLSAQSKRLIRDLRNNEDAAPVRIDAYVSPSVPESYVQTRLDLLSTLREFEALGGGKVNVNVHSVQPYSETATSAEEQYGITAQTIDARKRGAYAQEEIYLGAAIISGLEKVIVPFFDKGLPAEYELVRSIATVSQEERKKLGVITTDANLFGGFDMSGGFSRTPEQQVITELKKQYEVVQVDPAQPIADEYDVLLAVQPSSLVPDQMDNFLAAVYRGTPTAIFEDPVCFFFQNVPGTAEEKRPQGGNMMMGMQPPEPKGDINRLWSRLGVLFNGDQVAFQIYNPYPKLERFEAVQWLFASPGSGAKEPFNANSPITKDLHEVLFVLPSYINKKGDSKLDFTPLVQTAAGGSDAIVGFIPTNSLFTNTIFGRQFNPNLGPSAKYTTDAQTLAARIQGTLPPAADEDDPFAEPAADGEAEEPAGEEKVDVVLVSDIDCLSTAFFQVRAQGADEFSGIDFQMENVTFVLNIIDSLAGDERFLPIRSRVARHRTLESFERQTQSARQRADEKRKEFQKNFDAAIAEAQQEFDEELAKLESSGQLDSIQVGVTQQRLETQLAVKRRRLERERDTEVRKIETEVANDIRKKQDAYKFAALALPPILPLLVGVFVFFNRKAREKEGVARSRLRS